MIMKSLHSKNFVSEVYNWGYKYFCINKEGVEFLREELGIEEKVIPKTFQKEMQGGPEMLVDEEEQPGRPRRGFGRDRGGDRGGDRGFGGRGRGRGGDDRGEGGRRGFGRGH